MSNPGSISEESLMRTRLMIDGDGLGEDRRMGQFLKAMIKFCSMDSNDSEEVKKSHDLLMAVLAHLEWNDKKNKLIQAMNQAEAVNYENLYKDIEDGISKATDQIEISKMELTEARKIRKNKMEYDSMAKLICKNPDRATSGEKLEEIKKEIQKLKNDEARLDAKLETRKKEFFLLMQTLHEIRTLLDEEEEEEDQESTQDELSTSAVSSSTPDDEEMETS